MKTDMSSVMQAGWQISLSGIQVYCISAGAAAAADDDNDDNDANTWNLHKNVSFSHHHYQLQISSLQICFIGLNV